MPVTGLARARFATGGQFHWKLEWGAGEAPTSWNVAAQGNSSSTVTSFGSIDLSQVRAALASFTPPADLAGPTFSALSTNPYKNEFTVRLTVTGQGIPTPGDRPPRPHLDRRPDPAAGLPEAAGHRRRGADPLRRPQRRQRPGADRPDRGRRDSTPTSRTARSCPAGRSTPSSRSRPSGMAARPGSRRLPRLPRTSRHAAPWSPTSTATAGPRSSTRPASTSTSGSPTARCAPASRSPRIRASAVPPSRASRWSTPSAASWPARLSAASRARPSRSTSSPLRSTATSTRSTAAATR